MDKKNETKKVVGVSPDSLMRCKIVALIKDITVSAFVEYCINKVLEEEGLNERVDSIIKLV